MIITHNIEWDKCLSHKIWPVIQKGWQDTPMKPIHFFWGLAGKNIPHIKSCIEKTEEMLDSEKKLPPASQMVRDLAVTHWKTLGAWL